MNCPYCDSEKDYTSIGTHWSLTESCQGPVLKGDKEQIILGLLLSGAHHGKAPKEKNKRIRVETKSEGLAKWLDSELGILSTGVRKREREKQSEFAKEHQFGGELYELATRSCKAISDLDSPNWERLDWLSWKVVFARKGVYNVGWNSYLQIQTGNTRFGKKKMIELLNQSYGEDLEFYEQKQAIRTDSEEKSEKFMRWIGYPIPGAEWRWDPSKKKEDIRTDPS